MAKKSNGTVGATVSIKIAAKMLGLSSLIHVRGMVRKGLLAGATKDEHGFWLIPATSVQAEAAKRAAILKLRNGTLPSDDDETKS